MKYLFFKFNYQLVINSISNHKYFLEIQYTYNIKHTVNILLSLVNYLLRNSNFHKQNEYSEIIDVKD